MLMVTMIAQTFPGLFPLTNGVGLPACRLRLLPCNDCSASVRSLGGAAAVQPTLLFKLLN